MRYLGIDFGSKNIGLAISDENNRMAFPKFVIPFNLESINTITDFAKEKKIFAIVMGESKDYSGKDNKIAVPARVFAKELEKNIGVKVHFEPEFLTSHQAEKIQGKNDKIDASAASIILQSFLDRMNNKA